MDNIKIEYLPISDLTPYERNQRKHADYDVSQIMVSIQKYGFNDPIGVWSDKKFVAVSCHYDILKWLKPDWVFDTNKMQGFFGQTHNLKKNLQSGHVNMGSGRNLANIII